MTASPWGRLQQTRSVVFTRDGGLLWYNQALWGGPPCMERLTGHKWQEFLHEPDREAVLAWVRRGNKGERVDFQMMGPRSGRMRAVYLVAWPLKGLLAGIGGFLTPFTPWDRYLQKVYHR